MGRPKGICALCEEEKLLCMSHIVPRFCYKPVKINQQIHSLRFSNRAEKKIVQDGIKEYLLCHDCEQLLQKYETIFNNTWLNTDFEKYKISDDAYVIDVNYTAFKLFHLSILWRFYKAKNSGHGLDIGKYYSNKIRHMLLKENAGPETHFPVIGTLLLDEQKRQTHIIAEPLVTKFEHSRIYNTAYAGCEWWILLTDHPSLKQLGFGIGLQEKGKMLLLECPYREGHHFQFMVSAIKQYDKKNLSRF